LGFLENELTDAFKHLKYYFPDFEAPDVYTYISGFDHEYPIHYDGRIMLIALDMYLGQDYGPYKKLGVPEYRVRKFNRAYITRDCIEQVAKAINNSSSHEKNLLDIMIGRGKVLYFLDAIIPGTNDSIKIKYSGQQIMWAINNEPKLWAFLIENELLYSSDKNVEKKLLLDAPFTSYFGNESPPRLGEWIGWKIVSRFMESNPDVELEALLKEEDSQGILHKSGYKPEQ
ncbi:MAG: gliding motility lipoprotein GldB, partial [Bacteroidetes bacterium]